MCPVKMKTFVDYGRIGGKKLLEKRGRDYFVKLGKKRWKNQKKKNIIVKIVKTQVSLKK